VVKWGNVHITPNLNYFFPSDVTTKGMFYIMFSWHDYCMILGFSNKCCGFGIKCLVMVFSCFNYVIAYFNGSLDNWLHENVLLVIGFGFGNTMPQHV